MIAPEADDGLSGVRRLLIFALAVQGWMVCARLETLDELRAICLFHLVGLYARSTMIFRPFDRDRRMPLLPAFILTHQIGAWSTVHVDVPE